MLLTAMKVSANVLDYKVEFLFHVYSKFKFLQWSWGMENFSSDITNLLKVTKTYHLSTKNNLSSFISSSFFGAGGGGAL